MGEDERQGAPSEVVVRVGEEGGSQETKAERKMAPL